MRLILIALAAVLFCSCTTCDCNLAQRQNKQAQKLLSEATSQVEEMRKLRAELLKERLRAEAAEKSARISAQRAEDAMRMTRALFMRLQAVQKEAIHAQ